MKVLWMGLILINLIVTIDAQTQSSTTIVPVGTSTEVIESLQYKSPSLAESWWEEKKSTYNEIGILYGFLSGAFDKLSEEENHNANAQDSKDSMDVRAENDITFANNYRLLLRPVQILMNSAVTLYNSYPMTAQSNAGTYIEDQNLKKVTILKQDVIDLRDRIAKNAVEHMLRTPVNSDVCTYDEVVGESNLINAIETLAEGSESEFDLFRQEVAAKTLFNVPTPELPVVYGKIKNQKTYNIKDTVKLSLLLENIYLLNLEDAENIDKFENYGTKNVKIYWYVQKEGSKNIENIKDVEVSLKLYIGNSLVLTWMIPENFEGGKYYYFVDVYVDGRKKESMELGFIYINSASRPSTPINEGKVRTMDAEAWISKGIAYYSQCNFADAIKAFDEAIRLDPNSVDAWNWKSYAIALQKTNMNDPDALKAHEEAERLGSLEGLQVGAGFVPTNCFPKDTLL